MRTDDRKQHRAEKSKDTREGASVGANLGEGVASYTHGTRAARDSDNALQNTRVHGDEATGAADENALKDNGAHTERIGTKKRVFLGANMPPKLNLHYIHMAVPEESSHRSALGDASTMDDKAKSDGERALESAKSAFHHQDRMFDSSKNVYRWDDDCASGHRREPFQPDTPMSSMFFGTMVSGGDFGFLCSSCVLRGARVC